MIKAISDFTQLNKHNVLTVNLIEGWLLKYAGQYKEIYDFVYNQHLCIIEDGSTVRLPPFGKKTDQEFFLDLYEALHTIFQLHENEKYFYQQMILYHQIRKSKSDLEIWVFRNEDLGANKYVCFFLDYLDYDVDEKVEHLSIFVPSLKEIKIFIDRQNFKHTIDFLEIFNELYWVQKILPESLERIRTKINLTKPPTDLKK